MSEKSWHNYEAGDRIQMDHVIARCREHVNSGKVKNFKEKRLWIKIIANSGHPKIVYSPREQKRME